VRAAALPSLPTSAVAVLALLLLLSAGVLLRTP
jgi:hypothetical protein